VTNLAVNKYTFNCSITPPIESEFSLHVPPFDVVARESTLTLKATADAADEQRLRAQADEVAQNLARSLSFERGDRFQVACGGYHVLRPSGQQSVTHTFHVRVNPAVVATSGTVECEVRDAAGNVIDSSALRREREQQAMQQRVALQATRAVRDAHLRDMLDHWARYAADGEGRLHPLYDVLQVAECRYGSRKKAATALKILDADLSDLGRISNDPTMLNGRHPGRASGPHRIATEAEVATCERVARAIIENYAATVVI
jgi:hypothetical protein